MTPDPPRVRRHRTGLRTACVAALVGVSAVAAVPDTAVATDSDRTGGVGHRLVRRPRTACVRGERTRRPRLSYLGGAVRCLEVARVETTSSVRWSTCATSEAAPGERCETGAATIAFRAKRAEKEWRRSSSGGGVRGWPREVLAWHLYGNGTATCRHDRHGPAGGDPGARRSASGRINHVDLLSIWPDRQSGLLMVGVNASFNNDLPSALDELAGTIACRPLFAQPHPPAAARVRLSELLERSGVTTTVRSTRLATRAMTIGAPWRPLGLRGRPDPVRRANDDNDRLHRQVREWGRYARWAITMPADDQRAADRDRQRHALAEDDRGQHEARERLQELQRRDPGDAAAVERPVPADVADDRGDDGEEEHRAPRRSRRPAAAPSHASSADASGASDDGAEHDAPVASSPRSSTPRGGSIAPAT